MGKPGAALESGVLPRPWRSCALRGWILAKWCGHAIQCPLLLRLPPCPASIPDPSRGTAGAADVKGFRHLRLPGVRRRKSHPARRREWSLRCGLDHGSEYRLARCDIRRFQSVWSAPFANRICQASSGRSHTHSGTRSAVILKKRRRLPWGSAQRKPVDHRGAIWQKRYGTGAGRFFALDLAAEV